MRFILLLVLVAVTGCQDNGDIEKIKMHADMCKAQNIPYEVSLPPDASSSVVQYCQDNHIPYKYRGEDAQTRYAREVRKISDDTGVPMETVRRVYKGNVGE